MTQPRRVSALYFYRNKNDESLLLTSILAAVSSERDNTNPNKEKEAMAFNNIITLKGNLGKEARCITTETNEFMVASLATTDSYQDEHEKWQQKESVWHNLIAFSPAVIQILGNLKTGTRIEVLGSITYRNFHAADATGSPILTKEGDPVLKREATILVRKITLAPLPKKG